VSGFYRCRCGAISYEEGTSDDPCRINGRHDFTEAVQRCTSCPEVFVEPTAEEHPYDPPEEDDDLPKEVGSAVDRAEQRLLRLREPMKDGEAFPAMLTQQIDTGFSQATIRKAFHSLKRKGLVEGGDGRRWRRASPPSQEQRADGTEQPPSATTEP
jgi:hypothetical protein